MHVMVTGAAGFVGAALANRLARDGQLAGRAIRRLTLVDLSFGAEAARQGIVHRLAGDLADSAWLDVHLGGGLGGEPIDAVFHLASIPGGMAEAQPALARRVNVEATMDLLERGHQQVAAGGAAPRFIFASSIAVFGELPARVDDDTPTQPVMRYGAHKLIGEVLVDHYHRRGWIDGCSLRLPGVLARPPARTGQLSAFLSDMIRELGAGRRFVCPMSPEATTWASSLPNVVDNLVHAAEHTHRGDAASRALTLPTSHFSMRGLVEALATVHGPQVRGQVKFKPDAHIERLFGQFPPLATPRAEAVGYRADASLVSMVRAAVGHTDHTMDT